MITFTRNKMKMILFVMIFIQCLMVVPQVNSYAYTLTLRMTSSTSMPSADVSSSNSRIQAKEKLKKFFTSESTDNDIFICPESLSPLTKQTRIFGLFSEKVSFSCYPSITSNHISFSFISLVDVISIG